MGCTKSKGAQPENPFDMDDMQNVSSVRGSKADMVKGDKFQFVIVGFGVAGGYAASKLAELGVKDFDVAIVGEEPTFAYERPALTKGYLFPPGGDRPARLPKFHTCVGTGGNPQTEEWYQERNWTCYLSTKVLNIDMKKKILRCQGPNNEEWIRYDKLIVCTGSKANKLTCPGSDLKNIYYLRNEADAAALVRKMERESGNRFTDRKLAPLKNKSGVLQSTRRLGKDEQMEMMRNEDENEDEKSYNQAVILGAGYIGVEVACAMSGWGFNEIHLVFRQQMILTNMPWPTQFREKVQAEILRRAPNLKLHPGCTVEKLSPRQETAQALGSVTLSDGTEIESHILVTAIGATPCGKELFNKKAVTVVNNNNLAVDENLRLKSSESKDVWVCGELAHGECGVEAARAMGKYAGENAFNDHMMAAKDQPPYNIPYPFHYSRLFEFTKSPLIWNQIGTLNGVELESRFCGENNQCGESGAFAVFFHIKNSDVLKAALTCGSTPDKDFMDAVRKLVESGKATIVDAVKEFESRGYAM